MFNFSKKETILTIGLGSCLCTTNLVANSGISSDATLDKSKPMNLVYFHTHDSGRYIQPYGYAIPMPTFQKLAEQGIVFRDMHSVAPTCSPSRAALTTGRYPHQTGMFSLAHFGFKLNDFKQHINYTLQQNGYHTVLAGIQHITVEPKDIGYDTLLAQENGQRKWANYVVPEAVKWLEQYDFKQPLFLNVGLLETHRPFDTDDVTLEESNYLQVPSPLPDNPETRRDMVGFIRHAKAADDGLRMLIDALKAKGQLDNTIIFLTTDHGVAFPPMKNHLTNHGTGVYGILIGKGIPKGVVSDALVSHLDVFPTLCDLLDIQKPDWLEGKSLMPIIKGEQKQIHSEIFTQSNYHGNNYLPRRCVRNKRWAYVQWFEDTELTGFPSSDGGLSTTFWKSYGYGSSNEHPKEMLYDLVFDPMECNNLADDPKYTKIKTELKSKLQDWMIAKKDPMLHGPIRYTGK